MVSFYNTYTVSLENQVPSPSLLHHLTFSCEIGGKLFYQLIFTFIWARGPWRKISWQLLQPGVVVVSPSGLQGLLYINSPVANNWRSDSKHQRPDSTFSYFTDTRCPYLLYLLLFFLIFQVLMVVSCLESSFQEKGMIEIHEIKTYTYFSMVSWKGLPFLEGPAFLSHIFTAFYSKSYFLVKLFFFHTTLPPRWYTWFYSQQPVVGEVDGWLMTQGCPGNFMADHGLDLNSPCLRLQS